MATVGGIHESGGGGNNNLHDFDGLTRIAVQEHNAKKNALLEFGKVIKAEEQVVAGTLHHITRPRCQCGILFVVLSMVKSASKSEDNFLHKLKETELSSMSFVRL
uniref:Cysteine proteinase inhibitor n=1 Tax=Kalanchoe fedtschenkoi TaxID=63787 RepID=A0A7N0TQC7_KALFE